MKLPDQPSFVLPVQSFFEPAASGAYASQRGSGELQQSAPAYRQKPPKAQTRKAKQLEPMVVATEVVAAGSRIGRNL